MVTIDAMTGARPATTDHSPPFELLQKNLEALFQGTDTRVVVPESYDEIGEIPNGSGEYTLDKLLALAEEHRHSTAEGPLDLSIYILFADGTVTDPGYEGEALAGVSFNPENVVVIFDRFGDESPVLARTISYLEQMSMIHEVGHLFGLVDAGIPMVSDHLDENHPGHCTKSSCVMFRKTPVQKILDQKRGTTSDDYQEVLFGDKCMADFQNALGIE